MSGGCLIIAVRRAWGVSPVRTALRIVGSFSPARWASSRIPCSGLSRFRSMSLFRALRGGDVEDADPRIELPGEMLLNQMIDGPEECRKRFARAGRCEDERMLPAGNARPPQNLRRSRFPVRPLEPGADDRVEIRQNGVSRHGRMGSPRPLSRADSGVDFRPEIRGFQPYDQ